MQDTQSLLKKIQTLPAARIEEVEDFIDFLMARERERASTREATEASAPVFQAVWDNPEDDVYDATVIARSVSQRSNPGAA
jgi:hypothetical protein